MSLRIDAAWTPSRVPLDRSLDLSDVTAATILFMDGRVDAPTCVAWARWVLEQHPMYADHAELLEEFLRDWAAPRGRIDVESVDVWQSRLALAQP